MTKAKTFQDIVAWQKAHVLVLEVYKITKAFPDDERYGLTSQIRRAAVSIAANIAEGFRRKSRTEKLRFYNIAQASLEEVRYYLILAKDLDYIQDDNAASLLLDTSRLLNTYAKSIAD